MNSRTTNPPSTPPSANSAKRPASNSNGYFKPLSPIRQKGGKHVYAWALAGNLDATKLVSNTFDLEWPPKSGRMKSFPEVDRGAWYSLDAARAIINPAQIAFLDELAEILQPPEAK